MKTQQQTSAVRTPTVPAGSVQRRLAREARSTDHAGGAAPPIVSDVLRSPGEPLDPVARTEMESGFGHDFGQVRVHADSAAADSAAAVDALAYTVGQDVVFGRGQYAPQTPEGRKVLAHELTHTIQQGAVPQSSSADLTVTDPDSAVEHEADAASEAVVARTVAPGSAPLAIARTGAPPKKTVTVNITKVFGSTRSPDSDLVVANTIYAAANIEVKKGTDVALDETKSKAIMGSDLILEEYASPSTPTTEEKALFKENQTAGAVTMYFVKAQSAGNTGEAFWPATGSGLLGCAITNSTVDNTFAHELGHVLLDDGAHGVPDATYLMWGIDATTRAKLTPDQITNMRSSTFAK
jgi:hypothetical protein